jgi:two-component system nitrogen regulation response regulator NtrX
MDKKPEILIIDDDMATVDSLSSLFRDHGYSTSDASNGSRAFELAKNDTFDLIILDLGLPDTDGLELLKKFRAERITAPVIIVSGQATIRKAIEATRLGAFNVIEKPPDPEKLLLDSQIAIKQRSLELEVARLRHSLLSQNDFVGESTAIQSLREKLKRVAASDSRVYIWGEPGVGKEMAARFLHFSSPRAAGPFVPVNCAAVPGELFESEFFGHEKGAFTGAVAARKGKFEMADGGTLFLDEVAELKPDHQAKLLRVVESSVVQRLGSSKEIMVDVRVTSASNKDLKRETREGRFREDLYFRLNVIPVHVPPLLEHKDDIPLLARHFLDLLGYGYLRLEPAALSTLSMYDWPGNIRELKNIIERTAALCYRNIITVSDIEEALSGVFISADSKALLSATAPLTLRQHTNRFEKLLLGQVLSENERNITKAARILKMDRGNLSKKLKKYGLTGKE